MTPGAHATFGRRFLEAYELRGGVLAAFRGDHVASMRAAERDELLELVRNLGILGQTEAELNGLRRVRQPDDLARQVLDKQEQVTGSNLKVTLICAVVAASTGVLYLLFA